MGEQEYIGGLGGWLVQRSPRVPEILYEFRETVLSKFASWKAYFSGGGK